MLSRLWIALLALVLATAPVDVAFAEVTDAKTKIAACDDDNVVHVVHDGAGSGDTAVRAIADHAAVRTPPAPARVFRPPRPAAD